MLYEDNKGWVCMPEDIEMLQPWEIEEMGIHVAGPHTGG